MRNYSRDELHAALVGLNRMKDRIADPESSDAHDDEELIRRFGLDPPIMLELAKAWIRDNANAIQAAGGGPVNVVIAAYLDAWMTAMALVGEAIRADDTYRSAKAICNMVWADVGATDADTLMSNVLRVVSDSVAPGGAHATITPPVEDAPSGNSQDR